MAKRILLLGHTGKMGLALTRVLAAGHDLVGLNSGDFDAAELQLLDDVVAGVAPDLIINTVAFQGIDRCELEPERAFRINTLFPGRLASICADRRITLVHFSTDAVFADTAGFCTENRIPSPLNLYGVSKYGGDCLVSSNCPKHFICRIPILFGESPRGGQFVEKMLARLKGGEGVVRVASDIISSPSYSLDIAERVLELVTDGAPYGVYHLANGGVASLYELMTEFAANLFPGVVIEEGSYRDFPFIGRKNLSTPLRSVKTEPLRPWRDAVTAYCRELQAEGFVNG